MRDMTAGRPLKHMWAFAGPLMLSSLFSQLYTLADSMIVGRLLGTEAFAAIGAAGYLYGFASSMLLGMAIGFGVLMAQRCGAKDEAGLRRSIAMSTLLEGASALLLTIVCTALLVPLLRLLQTPEAMMPDSINYLRVMWLGLMFNGMYQVLASALRSMGDSGTPFRAGVVANVLNVALDFALIGGLRMGVAGAALATVIAQLLSAVLCALGIAKVRSALPRRGDWKIHAGDVRELLRLGVPKIFGEGFNAVGELVVQAAINSCGVAFVAGITAARKYYTLLSTIGGGLEGATATFTAQNMGAKRYDRITEGTRTAVISSVVSAAGVAVAAGLLAKPLILLFLPDASAETLRIGMSVLRIDSIAMVALYLLLVYRAAVQGMGNALAPMFSGIMEMAMRVGCALALPLLFGSAGLYFIEAVNWTATGTMLALCYRRERHKLEKRTDFLQKTAI